MRLSFSGGFHSSNITQSCSRLSIPCTRKKGGGGTVRELLTFRGGGCIFNPLRVYLLKSNDFSSSDYRTDAYFTILSTTVATIPVIPCAALSSI